ncbi:MAG: nucleotidyltransferase [Gammaproteobacteria bacterium]|uniref:Nucleotidyltransferase family protein n=1 Tax=endosymbiont of Bathymodiolus septemdierum str. Myojin knoll TaxID=1303921 RepID=A0A0P0UQP6_9GAMM|nr:HI0074 family nucleotidyltransferase substrate-binding subunit [Bathymodiolus septemdierum thioautotrophic gill symbiont]RUA05942.1 MAG: nucleotidyltransferase [Gammaproteobacteria bacterium]BAS67381.1 nucleotidyltransferase family protein [endosymbiont of Bathymodiolus septemdierum str. Myojin knoll]
MINSDYLNRCIASLIKAYELLTQQNKDEVLHDVYRSASIKEFELILEQSGKLLKKAIQPYFSDNLALDRLFFKDIFRYGHKFGLLNEDETKRWLAYRDSRNQTAHNYGEKLAQKTISLVPEFIIDSQNLVKNIEKLNATK